MNKKLLGHYALLLLVTLAFIFPLVWMVLSSLKGERAIFEDLYGGIRAFLPTEVTFSNYMEVFQRIPFWRYLINSLFVTGMTVGLGLIVNSMAGYAFARMRFPGKHIIFAAIIALVIIPFESIVLPLFLIVKNFGWLDSYTGLIVPFIGHALSIFLFRQFFLTLPKSLEEAARIDGCGVFKTFFYIVVPSSTPVFATAAILNFTGNWNSFLWPLIAVTDQKYYTIQLGIESFFTAPPVYFGQIMAALTLASLPMLLVFISLQRYFVEGFAGMGK